MRIWLTSNSVIKHTALATFLNEINFPYDEIIKFDSNNTRAEQPINSTLAYAQSRVNSLMKTNKLEKEDIIISIENGLHGSVNDSFGWIDECIVYAWRYYPAYAKSLYTYRISSDVMDIVLSKILFQRNSVIKV